MATVSTPRVREFGRKWNGIVLTPREFDRAPILEGWRYELIHEVIVVTSPWPPAGPRRNPSRIDAS